MTMDTDDILHKIILIRQRGLEYFDSVKRLEAGIQKRFMGMHEHSRDHYWEQLTRVCPRN